MDEAYREELERKLSPSAITATLIDAGCLLTGWELVRWEVIEKVRGFHTFGFDEHGPIIAPDYQVNVLSRDKSPFKASIAWLVDANAIDLSQADLLLELRDHRNEVAHELAKILVDPEFKVRIELIRAAHCVIQALGQFWGSIEVDTNPDFDGKNIDPVNIQSGSFLLFDYVWTVSEQVAAMHREVLQHSHATPDSERRQ